MMDEVNDGRSPSGVGPSCSASSPASRVSPVPASVPNALKEALGSIVSMCADARDVFPDAQVSFEAVTEAVNELYGCVEDGVFGRIDMSEAEHIAQLDSELVGELRHTAKRVLGGNCTFADADLKLLARLAACAIDAGLYAGITDCRTLRNIATAKAARAASAIEARRAETGTGSVHESAVPQADATPEQPTPETPDV